MKDKNIENEIILKLEHILKEHFNIDCKMEGSMRDVPLTAVPYRLAGGDLYRLLMLLENEFVINISSSEIRESGFHTINEITRIIEMKI